MRLKYAAALLIPTSASREPHFFIPDLIRYPASCQYSYFPIPATMALFFLVVFTVINTQVQVEKWDGSELKLL